ncbi:MAG TPA: hypothetical protein PKM73_20355 [Verrucomicrobiota bacterium]|nr:hypothetical protein [Verrucomicrobiota bacterium]HNU53209.1 hypothetical protein [Verrucomicrobiota bacterium]
MKPLWISLGVGVLCLAGCGKKAPQPAQTNAAPIGNPLTAPADYVGAIARSQRQAAKVTDLASLTRAIQMFQATEDRYPTNLNELVAKQYMPALPALPSGMKYQYDPSSGQVKAVNVP